ncbi:MAG: AAA family ATPase [Deltaproteobacteria bacterium]|nr:AAA family ATPase [Deltaproteobacteria bacterium]
MYLSYYKLHHKPFQISPDPRFLWLGEKHKEALAVLKYGVLNNQGFLLLTGDVGTGKTTLINTLVNNLGSETLFINVADPRLDKLDFFKLLAHAFGLESKLNTKFDFLISFRDFLNRAHDDQKKVLLIVDEAQKLSLDSLEEIRLLSNIERPDTKLLNVFFIGQNEFNETLLRPQSRALRQRITIVHNIGPLNEAETAEYVKYRLRVAGAQREIFTGEAVRKIFQFSKGYPRLINTICDMALLAGYSDNLLTIGPKVIQECSKDLTLPGEMKQQPPGSAGSKARQRKRTRPFSWMKAAIFAGLALLVAFSGFFFASGIPGSQGLSLQKIYATLGSFVDRNFPKASPEKIERQESSRPSPLSPPAALSSGESAGGGTQEPPPKPLKVEKSLDAETVAQGNPFRAGRMVIPFGFNVNDLPPEVMVRLDELAGYLLRKPHTEIVIKGYTDTQGSKDYNRNLSAFRANVVKSYLTGKGISPNRMKVIGMGDEGPRMPNTTAEGRSANRRVEIELGPPKS